MAPPTVQYTCAQQASFGKCSRSWMQGFCIKSCGVDVPPSPARFTCAQQASFGQCKQTWMKGYCLKTCGTDEPPPAVQNSCAKQASNGQCPQPTMVGYCLKSCGMCSSSTQSVPTPTPVLPSPLMHPSTPSHTSSGEPYKIQLHACNLTHGQPCIALNRLFTSICKAYQLLSVRLLALCTESYKW